MASSTRHATNQILDDLVALLQPRRMTVVGDFSVRGGITTMVTADIPARLMTGRPDGTGVPDIVTSRSRPSSICMPSRRATSRRWSRNT